MAGQTYYADGIQFPATQVQSADVNRLDDYQEGTWTPGLSFGGGATGITYSAQVGAYTKIGNTVFITGRVVLTSNGSDTGNALITGLPFANDATNICVLSAHARTGVTLTVDIGATITTNASTIQLRQSPGASFLTDTEVTNTADIFISGQYRTTE